MIWFLLAWPLNAHSTVALAGLVEKLRFEVVPDPGQSLHLRPSMGARPKPLAVKFRNSIQVGCHEVGFATETVEPGGAFNTQADFLDSFGEFDFDSVETIGLSAPQAGAVAVIGHHKGAPPPLFGGITGFKVNNLVDHNVGLGDGVDRHPAYEHVRHHFESIFPGFPVAGQTKGLYPKDRGYCR